ncbi:MAG: hypothetical protein CM1200mP9_05620 [Gammaproteobacteria bacterium]|nr:MAG: hypothetical protein CM1200mP9_05620 [Gammaproteobacteria bacterium]
MWSNRWLFVLAAAGSAVGLGNIWKFPYIAGENGGGVFVVAYLFCVALVGIPVMVAEVFIGRQGRQSPINSMRLLVQQSEGSQAWTLIGWAGVVAGFLILSFYSVIAGWGLYYIGELASGGFVGVDGNTATQALAELHRKPILMSVFPHGLHGNHDLYCCPGSGERSRACDSVADAVVVRFVDRFVGLWHCIRRLR